VPVVMKPFMVMTTSQGKFLYATKAFTDWVRKSEGISFTSVTREFIDDLVIVTVTAVTKDGRTDTSTGVAAIANMVKTQSGDYIAVPLSSEGKANAIMKAETKAKRRVTLSLGGFGVTDEAELDTIPNVKVESVNIPVSEEIKEEGVSKSVVAEYVKLFKKAMAEGKQVVMLPIETSTQSDFEAAIESIKKMY
jgi:hypothetical protein